MDELITRSVKLSAIITTVCAILALGITRNSIWAAGLAIASIWSTVNYAMTMRLLEIAILKRSMSRLNALLLIKFPVLYLAGFFVLSRHLFPTLSILAGLPIIFIALGIAKTCPKRT